MNAKPQGSLWPISITLFFVIAVIGIAVFIGWAVHQDMDLVRVDYYAEEIRFQQQIERVHRTAQLSQSAEITYKDAAQVLLVSIPAERGSGEMTGQIQLYRPSDASLDQNIKLSLDVNGEQRVNVGGFRSGLWKVRIRWQMNGEEFYVDESIVLKTKQS